VHIIEECSLVLLVVAGGLAVAGVAAAADRSKKIKKLEKTY
jgi:hypothetical protein